MSLPTIHDVAASDFGTFSVRYFSYYSLAKQCHETARIRKSVGRFPVTFAKAKNANSCINNFLIPMIDNIRSCGGQFINVTPNNRLL